jgi:hypothetical protein
MMLQEAYEPLICYGGVRRQPVGQVTVHDRRRAQQYIRKLRDQQSRKTIAELLDLSPAYITFAEKLTKRIESQDTLKYLCPAWAIEKILHHEKQSARLS